MISSLDAAHIQLQAAQARRIEAWGHVCTGSKKKARFAALVQKAEEAEQQYAFALQALRLVEAAGYPATASPSPAIGHWPIGRKVTAAL